MLLAAFELSRARRLAVSPFDDVTRNITKPKTSTPARTYVIGFVRRIDRCDAMLCSCAKERGSRTELKGRVLATARSSTRSGSRLCAQNICCRKCYSCCSPCTGCGQGMVEGLLKLFLNLSQSKMQHEMAIQCWRNNNVICIRSQSDLRTGANTPTPCWYPVCTPNTTAERFSSEYAHTIVGGRFDSIF
jgi:hypothetical protein